MSEKIDKTLKKMSPKTSADTAAEASPTTSKAKTEAEPEDNFLGDPNCPICHGTGYYRQDLPVGHPDFGKLQVCTCRKKQLEQFAYEKLFSLSQLDELSHLTFENFNPRGKKGKKDYSISISDSIEDAYETAKKYAQSLQGWLLIQGKFGSGKTHLAAAIANYIVEMRIPVLFATAPDLLDLLRFTYNDPETSFEERFRDFRSVKLLILDDFGTENATGWAREKLFQILNYRYINKLPLVITTNLDLDEIDARIRSRLQDEKIVEHVRILAPDHRLKEGETSTPALSMLDSLKDKTFRNFDNREGEIGQKARVTTTIEYEGSYGNKEKKTIIKETTISSDDVKTLQRAFNAAASFAEKPEGWLVFLGQSGCGKTHLAAAIGNYRVLSGAQAILVDVTDLLDFLRATFSDSMVTYQQRMHEVRTSPLLMLDGLGALQLSSWSEEKLYQILNYRYYNKLPTVITSPLSLEEIEKDYSALFVRMADKRLCSIYAIQMPMYRAMG
jgi:DNA replication protein DnaC